MRKIGEKLFELTIEQLDLFGIDLSEWNEKDYPERDNMIKEALREIEKEIKSKISLVKIDKRVG